MSDIKYKRRLLGLTVEEVGNMCCLSKQIVSNAENNKRGARESTKMLIRIKLGEYFASWDPSKEF